MHERDGTGCCHGAGLLVGCLLRRLTCIEPSRTCSLEALAPYVRVQASTPTGMYLRDIDAYVQGWCMYKQALGQKSQVAHQAHFQASTTRAVTLG